MRLFDDYQGVLAANSATLKADIAQGVADIEAAWTCTRRRASPATYDRQRRRVALKFTCISILRFATCRPPKSGRRVWPVKENRNALVLPSRWLLALDWMIVAGRRTHGTTRQQPPVLFELERARLKALPPRTPEVCSWARLKVHRDTHVHYVKSH